MKQSLAVRNIEAFCQLWSQEPDEIRRQVLLEIAGSPSGEPEAISEPPDGEEAPAVSVRN